MASKLIAAPMLALLLACSIQCRGPSMPFLGHWTGKFDVTQNTSGFPSKRVTLGGYLHIYRTGERALMSLSNDAQSVTINGTWKIEKDGNLIVHIAKVSIQQPPKDVMEASGTPFLDDSAINSGFKPDMIFQLSPDHGQLTGLLMTIGPLTGKFDLTKVGPPR